MTDADSPTSRGSSPAARLACKRVALIPVAAAALIAACAVVDPIRPPAYGTHFSNGKAADAAARAASVPTREQAQAGNATAGTTPPANTASGECAGEALRPGCFAGGLGLAIDQLDERRIELVHLAKQVSNGNATYNALLYPLGGAAVYEKLRGATNRNLLLPAVAAASLYGFVNSGIVDRERHYLRAASELHCAIVRSGSLLYLQQEIVADTGTRPGLPLDLAIARLHWAARDYSRGRVTMLGDLQPRPGSRPAALNSVQQRLSDVDGRGRGGSAGKDSRAEIDRRTRVQLEAAQGALRRARDLRGQIAESGLRLRSEWADIEQEFQRLLSERVPLPVAPEQAARELQSRSNELLRLQGAPVTAEPGSEDLDPKFPAALYDGISAETQPHLSRFASAHAVALADAREDVQTWLDNHAERKARVDNEVRRAGCSERLPPIPLRSASQPSSSQKPATGNTGGSNGQTSTTSPLPSASR